jgi:hypothetical protein
MDTWTHDKVCEWLRKTVELKEEDMNLIEKYKLSGFDLVHNLSFEFMTKDVKFDWNKLTKKLFN